MGDANREAGLEKELASLRERLRESEETLNAIRSGEVDAVVVQGNNGQQIYTLTNADRPYRVLIEQMREGAVTLSPDGVVVYCNDSFAALIGQSSERILGTHFRDLVATSDHRRFDATFASARGGSLECTLSAAGAAIPVTLSLSPIPDDVEEHLVCGIITDLREQLQRSRELSEVAGRLDHQIAVRAQAEAQLHQSQKMEIVGQLTGGLAHDFNNLLMVISGNLDLIGRRISDKNLTSNLANMRSAVERGARLSQQLLAFSRKQSLNPEPVCINDLLPEIGLLVRQAAGAQVAVEVRQAEGLWHCRADASQLVSALLNLVINGRDAMPGGGTIGITTSNVTLGERDMDAGFEAKAGRFVQMAVSDCGVGIASDVLPHIFEPFFTTKEVGKGTGLGLSQVYGFVRQSGGQIEIESKIGRGTIVRIFLPWCAAPAERTAPDIVSDKRQNGPPLKVLIVEDDDDVRELTTQILAALGYPFIAARSGPDALDVLRSNPEVKLLLSDIIMPEGMNGFQLAAEVKRRRPEVAIVLTSGFVGHVPQYDLLRNQTYEVVRKPFTEAELARALTKALSRSVG
jgi:PAS domain S-box-containing protein